MTWPGHTKINAHLGGRNGGYVPLGTALVPRTASLEIEGSEGAPDATVRCEIRNGRPEVVEIVIRAKPDGRGIRSADMSLLSNVDVLAENIVAEVAIVKEPDADRGPDRWVGHPPNTEQERWALKGEVNRARTATRGARGPSPELLERVAQLYRSHSAGSPVKVIAAQLGCSERTAARRVNQARLAGLLPLTTVGRKGV